MANEHPIDEQIIKIRIAYEARQPVLSLLFTKKMRTKYFHSSFLSSSSKFSVLLDPPHSVMQLFVRTQWLGGCMCRIAQGHSAADRPTHCIEDICHENA